jgi:NADH-quinone oxidoreductase subunit M
LSKTASASPYAYWIFAAFVLAFAVKTPLFPFHAWLPEAYYQASLPGTILLSALLSKAGIYGFLRIVLELFPEHLKAASPYLLTLAIIGVFYAGFIAWVEKDYKKLIAYSSLSHVNFILAGIFVWSPPAQAGAILQAINHGITITGLFLAAGWLEQRLGTTTIKVSGLAKFLPYLCWLTMIFVLSAIALPGTNSFIGEFMVLLGLFKENPWAAAVLTLSVILSVMYMLRWMQRVYFGEPSFFHERWVDLKFKEALIALPLVLLILWIGIYPAPVLNQIKAAMGQYAQLEKKS